MTNLLPSWRRPWGGRAGRPARRCRGAGAQAGAVADVDLGRAHLALAEVGEPGLELPDDQRIGERIEVAETVDRDTPSARASSAPRSTPGRGSRRCIVQNRRMVVAGTRLPSGEVAPRKGADVVVAPGGGPASRRRRGTHVAARPAPRGRRAPRRRHRTGGSHPAPRPAPRPAKDSEARPTRSRRALPARETAGPIVLVGQGRGIGKVLAALSLVDDHRATQVGQRERGLRQPGVVARVLHVEHVRGQRAGLTQRASVDLPAWRARQQHDRGPAHGLPHRASSSGQGITSSIYLEIRP